MFFNVFFYSHIDVFYNYGVGHVHQSKERWKLTVQESTSFIEVRVHNDD